MHLRSFHRKTPVSKICAQRLEKRIQYSRIEPWFKDTVLNIGIATGAASGIIAIDIDPRHEGDAMLGGA